MIIVTNFVRHVLVPIIYLIFLFSGFLCAMVSGYIELEVFQELIVPGTLLYVT